MKPCSSFIYKEHWETSDFLVLALIPLSPAAGLLQSGTMYQEEERTSKILCGAVRYFLE